MEDRTLTTKEKYDAVTTALDLIRSEKCTFMCTTLEKILTVNNVFGIMPELLDYKPISKVQFMVWFPKNDEGRKERIEVLIDLQKRFKDETIR